MSIASSLETMVKPGMRSPNFTAKYLGSGLFNGDSSSSDSDLQNLIQITMEYVPDAIRVDKWYEFTISSTDERKVAMPAVFVSQMECHSTNKDAGAKLFHVYFNNPQGSEVLHIVSTLVLEYRVGETYRIQIGEQSSSN